MIEHCLIGWFFVEAQLGRNIESGWVHLQVRRRIFPEDTAEIMLPVLPNGRIHELIQLPDDVTDLTWPESTTVDTQQRSLNIRRVGWLERNRGMVTRVFKTANRLSRQQRAEIGLSIPRVFFDLGGAYRIASQFRHKLPYAQWIERYDHLGDEDYQEIKRHVMSFAHPPHFDILLVVDSAEQGAIQTTLDSLKQQLFKNFTCAVLDVSVNADSTFNSGLGLKGAGLNYCIVTQPHVLAWLNQLSKRLPDKREWLMMLRPGDVMSADALYRFACESLARPNAAVFYSDDDVLDSEGKRSVPRFKPDWSLTHFRSTNFIGYAVAIRGDAIAAAGGLSQEDCKHGSYDLLLRVVDVVCTKSDTAVAHIPSILMHRMVALDKTTNEHLDWNVQKENINALHAHLARNGVAGDAVETLQDCRRIRFSLPDERPLVSVIIPMRDEPALIRQCVESLLEKTTYSRFEILVIDNQSTDQETLTYLEKISRREKIRVLSYDHPFNFSSMNNLAVSEMRGEVACLLNNDTEVISPDWLEEMVGHLLQPQVGVVGAKLYYPNGQVQHGGDLVGVGGVANHAHAFLQRNDPGYCNRAVVAQELSAVTAACMVTWKSTYEELGGLDEEHLKVAFNDVDYCLRVREAGYKVVWTPHAELYHHESVSRGKDTSWKKKRRRKREAAYMRKRWKKEMLYDPFYNPNLSYERPDFSLSHFPAVDKPWKK